ncbi:MAG TPA: hypothetical protein VM638_08660, partial [Actinomycetota bacterium]|nr:hypothetical protein [Actinomycetota bacterium]
MAWRGRVALFALFAVMLIPLGTSTLRGLSHVLICAEDVATPFTLTVEPGEEPTVTSSQTIERDAPPASGVAPTPSPSAGRLCGGL